MTKNTTTTSSAPVTRRRLDRWINERNKFGTSADPITQTRYTYDNKLDRKQLDALYSDDWLSRRVVEVPAKDATREWVTFTHEGDSSKAEKIKDECERLKVREKTEEAIILSRLYGGSLMALGAFDGQEMFLPLGNVRSVEFLEVTDRWLAFPQTYYEDPLDMRYGIPETYLIHRLQLRGSITSLVHESRLIRFEGNYLPIVDRLRNFGWSESVLQNAYEAMRQFGVGNQSGSAVLEDFVTKKMKISNLAELLSNDEGEAKVVNRLSMLAYAMSVHNIGIFGEDEEFDKMGTPVTGLNDLLYYFVDVVSAAVNIPKARLFHNQSGILGGDAGSNDLRVHYDNIGAYQENNLRPKLRRIVDVVGEPFGIKPGEVDFTFKSLWRLSEVDEATVRKTTAEGDEIYIRNQVVEPEEVAISRFGGDGVNVMDMVIDVPRREKYLKELSKQDIEAGEPKNPEEPEEPALGNEPPDPEDKNNDPG